MNDNELMHYGVLGMRWWHHKSPESYGGSVTKTGKYRASNKQKKFDKAYNKILSDESIGSKLMYGKGTYKKAAINMVNKGMDQKTAVSKAKAAAWRNTGLGIAASVVFANRDKLISGVKQYAITKAMQRVNKGLNRIGTIKLVKVAENVYERRMV